MGLHQGDLVLTAAHVVADARDIRVQLLAAPGASPVPWRGQLALLDVTQARRWMVALLCAVLPIEKRLSH